MGNIKYAIYADKIYESIFREKASEYRSILKLEKVDGTIIVDDKNINNLTRKDLC